MATVSLEHEGGYGSGADGRQATDEYLVVMSSPSELNRVTVLSASGVPAWGAAHPGDAGLFVWNKNSSRTDANTFRVSVTYRTMRGVWYPMAPGTTYSDVAPHISMVTQSNQEMIQTDINGLPVVNINGEPFEQLMEDVNDPVITITRNFASWSFPGVAAYRNAINSDTFLSFSPGQLRIFSLSVQPNRLGSGIEYYTGTVVMGARSDPPGQTGKAWWRRILNTGFYVKGSGGLITRALDDNGEPTISPVLLDANGQKTNAAGATWLYFQTRPALPFAALNFI